VTDSITPRTIALGAVILSGALGAAACTQPDAAPDLADLHAQSSCVLPDGARTFAQQATDKAHIDGACVPAYTSEDLRAAFAQIRDSRPLESVDQPGFARRIPWLAVDNGCEERAAAAAYYMTQQGFTTPYYAHVKSPHGAKLGVDTVNDPQGFVKWTGHVAPVVRVGGDLMVLDPALAPDGPLEISSWISRFDHGDAVDVALCRDSSIVDGCFEASPVTPAAPRLPLRGDDTLYTRLTTEWSVQEVLGRDPTRVLGDCPPWLPCATPEPAPDQSRPPSIRRFAPDQFSKEIYDGSVIYIIGDNFVPGVTTVRLHGAGIDVNAPIDQINRLRILLGAPMTTYPVGTYEVTAANGSHVSDVAKLVILPF